MTSQTYHPKDRGWSWVVMFGAMVVHVISIGFQRCSGVLFVHFRRKIGSTSATAAISGTQSFFYSTMTFLAMNVIVTRFSVRTSCLVGVTLQVLAVAISAFATDIYHLIITQGALYGCGHALVYLPSLFILSQYFDKRRPIATAIATSGASIGGMVFPVLANNFLEHFGLTGALLMLAGCLMQQFIVVGLYTPPEHYTLAASHLDDYTPSSSDYTPPDDCYTLDTHQLKQHPDVKPLLSDVSFKNETNVSQTSTQVQQSWKSNISKSTGDLFVQRNQLEKGKQSHLSCEHFRSSEFLKRENINNIANCIKNDDLKVMMSKLSQDSFTFINDLVKSDCTEKHFENGESYHQTEQYNGRHRSQGGLISRSFRLPDILYLSQFWLLAVYLTCAYLPASLPFVYLPSLAIEKGFSQSEGANLLSVSAAADIVGRLVPGVILNFTPLQPSSLLFVPSVALGTLFLLISFLHGYASLVCLAAAMGALTSSYWSLQSLLIIEVLGLDQLASAMGFYAMFQGVTAAVSFPASGGLNDVTGSYISVYYLTGIAYFVAAIFLIALKVKMKKLKKVENSD